MIFKIITQLYLLYTRREFKNFELSLKNPAVSQDKVLKKILHELNHSEYGKQFGQIKDYQAFRQIVPVVGYDDLRSYIEKQKTQNIPQLTADLPQTYEFTSGSSGAPKPIPYTKELLKSFQKLFKIWSYDILANAPFKLTNGSFYISISPLVEDHKGLEDDRDYLSGFMQKILGPFWVGHQLKKLKNLNDYQMALAITLISQPKLEIISIWSPSLLIKNLEFIEKNKKEVLAILKGGNYQSGNFHLNFKSLLYSEDIPLSSLFPSLKFISCWGSAGAKNDFKLLKSIFPQVYIQEKGLLATEAPLTIPLIQSTLGALPLVDDILFEFKDDEGNLLSLQEVKEESEYQLVFSQLGGLYRYQLGDVVKVGPRYHGTPTLHFIGRAGLISDLCGEKLSEAEVQNLFSHYSQDFFIFPNKDHYLILGPLPEKALEIDHLLMKSPHYKYARLAGQLLQCQCINVPQIKSLAFDFFTSKRNLKHGDIKLQKLYPYERDKELLDYLISRDK